MGKFSTTQKHIDDRIKILFPKITKEIGEGEEKKKYTLDYNDWTERFDFRQDGKIIVSSCSLKDCVSSAKEKGLSFEEEELVVKFEKIDKKK